ncbi:YhgE/Pip domain-containing protein [Schaalia sp. ZJ405]|uniref:YhgE/Pip domain-containing protein n=1 Tax=Schaalia sp. ZJ405 TaxID=2709403 RepID=UPI0013EC6FEB|nr:YhgE/Pip domain-containing protein [Schaalia sp. ZJ405]QPK81370.1 YhgE/Pip domain-containing protein [Schaalia sp. ZJ405]
MSLSLPLFHGYFTLPPSLSEHKELRDSPHRDALGLHQDYPGKVIIVIFEVPMSSVRHILTRDIRRILRVPAAWVIIFGIIALPPLYAWFNIYGLWDPYGNTASITVDVVNEDRGASSDTVGDLDAGEKIVAQLRANHQLNWQFTKRSDAMDNVYSGRSYAAIIIPTNFSARLIGVIDGDQPRPTLDFYVNEKANALTPKITNAGMTTLDRQINDTFVSTAASVIAQATNSGAHTIDDFADQFTTKALDQLTQSLDAVTKIRNSGDTLIDTLDNISQAADDTRAALNSIEVAANDASTALATTGDLMDDASRALSDFSAKASTQLDTSSQTLTRMNMRAHSSVDGITSALSSANGYTSAAVSSLTSINSDLTQVLDDLKDLTDSANTLPGHDLSSLNSAVTELEETTAALGTTLGSLSDIHSDLQSTIDAASETSESLLTANTSAFQWLSTARSSVNSQAIPQMTSGLTSLSTSAGTLAGITSGQQSLIAQARLVLDQIDSVTSAAHRSVTATDNGLQSLQSQLSHMSTDISALHTSSVLAELTGGKDSLNTESIARFMASPTVLETENIFPVDSYGSGMAPLFTTISLWVGAFMLVVMLRVEVDDDGLESLEVTTSQKYLARFTLLAIFATIQAIVVAVGNLIIGVQMVSFLGFLATCVVTSFVDLSVIFALSTTFQHVGKGLCLALIMVQVPGASGIYPTEMLPPFFSLIEPIVPFTYSIRAMRETIAGFYGNEWLHMTLGMMIFALASFIIGLVIRPSLTNLNRMFSRQIAESGMVLGEDIHLPDRRFSIPQILSAFTDQDAYREHITERAQRFTHWYPKLIRGALIAGLAVPTLLVLAFSLTPDAQVATLATWLMWLLLIIGFLIVVEYVKDSLERQCELGNLTEEEIHSVLRGRRLRRARRTRPRPRPLRISATDAPVPPADNSDEDDDAKDTSDAAHATDDDETAEVTR